MFGEPPQVLLRNACTVRYAVQVDTVVAQRLAQTIEIVDRETRRVLRDVGLGAQLLETGASFGGDIRR